MTQMRIKAVVFDVDGTLVDTEHSWDVVRRRLAADDGVPWPEESTKAMMGMSTPEWARHLDEVVGLHGDADDAVRRTLDGMVQLYHEGVPVLPGARHAVLTAASLLPVGIASSSPPVLIEAAMELLEITDVVESYVSTEQVERGKPAPDGYLKACELLQVDPSEAVAVEDSTPGIESALAAGMTVVAVPAAFHRPSDELLARCVVIDDLNAFTEELLLSL